jgi:Xaa-Pro dipeptidase
MMSEFAQSAIPAPGTMHVDFEERVSFERLRTYRLARARTALEISELGALLCFDMNNIRYLTSTNIGEWARDKLMRFALLAGGADPVLWDFGSAAKAHRLHSPWLRPEDSRAGMTGLRGSIAPEAGFFARAAREVKAVMDGAGVGDMPLGVDISEIPMLAALADLGVDVRDGQQTQVETRSLALRGATAFPNSVGGRMCRKSEAGRRRWGGGYSA